MASIRGMVKQLVRAMSMAAVGFAVLAAAPKAQAQLALPPGASVTPPAAVVTGAVIADRTTDFDILNAAGALLYRGKLQDRVTRRDSDGKLQFSTRIRDVTPGLNGIVSRIERVSFAGAVCSVDIGIGLGTRAAELASRSSAPGHVVTWTFSGGMPTSQDSKYLELNTDQSSYSLTGLTTIVLTTGDRVAVRTYTPAAGAPTAIITSPSAFSCVCNGIVPVSGTATAGGAMNRWILEYATGPAGPWTTIATSTTEVIGGVLANWNATALAQGYYWLRLTVANNDGYTDEFTTIAFLDAAVDGYEMRAPVEGGLYGGVVCFDGTASDHCSVSYTLSQRRSGIGAFSTFATGGGVVNDPLGSWNASGLADGNYDVRLTVTDGCSHSGIVTKTIRIDNTPPRAAITNPVNCTAVAGIVAVVGTAFDEHMSGWALQVTGGSYGSSWVTISTGTSNIVNGVLGVWHTGDLPRCCYTLRLLVNDAVSVNCDGSHQSETLASVDLADPSCGADFNQDGGIDGADVQAFFEVWENGGCL